MSPVVGPVRQSVRLSCPVQCVVYREALYWRLGLPSRRESGQRLVISTPLLVAPAARQRARRWAGREILSLSCGMPACLPACLLACLPVYLADLTIMNGHGAHRRQEGSQLAAEPACSRRVRAPSETWGEGCSWQVGEAMTRRVPWAWGWPYGPSWGPLGLMPDTPCPPPLRLINSVERTSTRPSHGKVVASPFHEPLGVCFLVRRQTPVGHGVFMPCHERVAPARTPTTRVRQMVEHSGDP